MLIDAVKYLGRYLKSTADLGLLFSAHRNTALEGYFHFPLFETDDLPSRGTAPHLISFCDANWGPQDASLPTSHGSLRQLSIDETRSICGHLLMMGGGPIFWKVHKKTGSVVVLVRLKLKQLMSVLRPHKCFITFWSNWVSSI